MIRFVSLILIVIFFNACGVDTSSSDSLKSNTTTVTGGNTNEPDNLIDPNPISGGDDNVTSGDSGSGTDNGSGVSDPGDGTDIEDSLFDSIGAVYDKNACDGSKYQTASDASYNGVGVGENGADFLSISGSGLEIRSEHLESSSSKLDKTWITLYYKTFPSAVHLGLQGYTSYILSGYFYITFDIAWTDASIPDIDNTMYIRSNQGEKPECHRLILNNIVGTLIDVQKVYR
jgi:hypothetical protein